MIDILDFCNERWCFNMSYYSISSPRKLTYQWIVNKSDYRGMYTVEFPPYSTDGVRWKLILKRYCIGKTFYTISLLDERNVNRKITYSLSVSDKYGNRVGDPVSRTDTISPSESISGYATIDLHTAKGNFLIIKCTIEEFCDEDLHDVTPPLGSLLDDEASSDVAVCVGEKLFRAHKLILSACSPVFDKMLHCEMSEGIRNRIDIEDFSAESVEALLRYMYTGRVENVRPVVLELLAAADKYDVRGLKDACETPAMAVVTCENATSTLLLAERIHATNLRGAVCVWSDVVETDEWKTAELNDHSIILKLLKDIIDIYMV